MNENINRRAAPVGWTFRSPEAEEKKGLALRPPKRLLRILHLAREHAVAVAFRPISFGNATFFSERVEEINTLGRELSALLSQLKPEWRDVSTSVAQLLTTLSIANRQEEFGRIVSALDCIDHRRFFEKAVVYAPPFRKTLLTRQYTRILVIAGPALGLGDENSCVEFVQSVAQACPYAELEFYGYYPGLWQTFSPASPVHSLVGRPLAAFDRIDEEIKAGRSGDTLVLFLNFSGLDLHLLYALDSIRPDIVEVAVGKGIMWFAEAPGPTVQVVHAMDPLLPGNYSALRWLAARLLGRVVTGPSPPPRPPRQARADCFQLMVNPFTSKEIHLTAKEWALLLDQTLAPFEQRKPITCWVLPGMSSAAVDYASNLVAETKARGITGLDIAVLGPGGPLQAETAFRQVYHCMRASDLVIGIDTFTSHLAAMLAVPSLAICYSRNVTFWPETPYALAIELRNGLSGIIPLASVLFQLSGGVTDASQRILKARLWRPEMAALEASWAGSTPDDSVGAELERITALGDIIWEGLPSSYRDLVRLLDREHAWPIIRSSLTALAGDEQAAQWALNLIRRSHFRKINALIAGLPTRCEGDKD